MPLIDPTTLNSLLKTARGRFDVDSVDSCDSTNSVLMQRAANGAPSGTVLVADQQSAGRGRRGRAWLSTPESGLTFSLLWRFSRPMPELTGLSLAIGVAVANALEHLGATDIGLKWPNDVLYRNAKLAGILVELATERRGALAVIGIGLNLQKPAGDLPHPVCGLTDILEEVPERHQLLAEMLISLAPVLDLFDAEGFAALQTRWQQHHAWQNQEVCLLGETGIEASGICLGADDKGALLLETAHETRRFLSGEISLRRFESSNPGSN